MVIVGCGCITFQNGKTEKNVSNPKPGSLFVWQKK